MPPRAKKGHAPSPFDGEQGIQFEEGVQPAKSDDDPRWLPLAIVAFGFAALVLLFALSPGQSAQDDRASESTPTTQTTTTQITTTQATTGPPEQRITELGRKPSAPFWLVELTPEPSDEQAIRMVNLNGTARELTEPVYFESTRWPPWAGAPLRPFITIDTSIIFPSRGEIVSAELLTGNSTVIGEGTAVVDGAAPGEFWVIGRGQRSVTRYKSPDAFAGERFSFDGVGRPVAAVNDGLIVTPRLEQNAGALAIWRPDGGVTPVPTEGLELLGTAGDMVVIGGQDRLVRYNVSTGEKQETVLDGQPDLHLASLSPDGTKLALAQRHPVTALGTLLIIDVVSGGVLMSVENVMDREFLWTSPDTLVTVGFNDQQYQVLEVESESESESSRISPLAVIRYPWVYLAATS